MTECNYICSKKGSEILILGACNTSIDHAIVDRWSNGNANELSSDIGRTSVGRFLFTVGTIQLIAVEYVYLTTVIACLKT